MSYNPLEISALVAFKSFTHISKRPTHKNSLDELEKKKIYEQKILAICRGQNVTAHQLPMIAHFSDGLIGVLLQTPTMGSDIVDHITHFDRHAANDINAVLTGKQLAYLNQSRDMLRASGSHRIMSDYDGIAYLGLEQKRRATANIFTVAASDLTASEKYQLIIWAQHVDAIKMPPGDIMPLVPSITPAPPLPPSRP